jgi:hypothetical protein
VARTDTGGRSPGQILVDGARGVLYVLNFLSDDIAVVDETTGDLVEMIR